MAEAKKAVKKKEEKKDGTTTKNNQPANKAADKELQEVKPAEVKSPKPKAKDSKEVPLAKAGKRSAKAVKEIEEKSEKEARKAETKTEPAKAKPAAKPPRSRLERRGKKYREASKLIDATKEYGLKEGLELVVKTSPVSFDATVEVHANLNLDPRQADQNIRGTLSLPAGTGKSIRVTVIGEPDEVAAAKKAGADDGGNEEILAKLEKGTIDFDVLITTPQQMAKLGKYARVLGPKGLMPNPKSGTVTKDIVKAVHEAKAGRVEYRVDGNGIVHLSIGKISFGATKLAENASAVLASIKSAKPSSVKGNYVTSIYLTSSMGPSIRLNANDVL